MIVTWFVAMLAEPHSQAFLATTVQYMLLFIVLAVSTHSCAVRVTIYSTRGKFHLVSNFM